MECMADRRGACRMLVDRPERKRLLRKPGHRWGANIKMDLQELGWACMDWIDQSQDRETWQVLVNAVVNHLVP
jgi:hypothetical protein